MDVWLEVRLMLYVPFRQEVRQTSTIPEAWVVRAPAPRGLCIPRPRSMVGCIELLMYP